MRLADSLKLWSLCATLVGSSLLAPAAQAQLPGSLTQAQAQSAINQGYGMAQGAPTKGQFASDQYGQFCQTGRWHGRPDLRRRIRRSASIFWI